VTIIDGRPQMLAEEFERIAAAAEREGVRLEFLRGKLGVKAVPDGDHDEIVR
jgi:Uma2 family endonuclease